MSVTVNKVYDKYIFRGPKDLIDTILSLIPQGIRSSVVLAYKIISEDEVVLETNQFIIDILKTYRGGYEPDNYWICLDENNRLTLCYRTTNVSFLYLAMLGKLKAYDLDGLREGRLFVVDPFTDRSVITALASDRCRLYARYIDYNNLGYMTFHALRFTTADHKIQKFINGTLVDLAVEAVDLTIRGYGYRLSVSGSSISSTRTNTVGDIDTGLASGVTISATDTDFTAGLFGARDYTANDPLNPQGIEVSEYMLLDAPASRIPQSIMVLDVDYIGTGKSEDDPVRPNLPSDIRCVDLDEATRFNDKCQDGKAKVDYLAITWGAFEFKPGKSSSVVIVVKDVNKYNQSALDMIRSKLSTIEAPKTYSDAISIYNKLRSDHPEWIAGKDNFAYHVIGHEEYEVLSVADFYSGFLIDHKTRPQYDQLKRVRDDELRSTINQWLDRLRKKRPNLPPSEADKHEQKLLKVLRLGW